MQFVWNLFGFYDPIVLRLRCALQEAGTRQILDLCSGGGGPWPRLIQGFEDKERFPIQVRLTDKFPNPKAFEHAQKIHRARIAFHAASVDAARIPCDLQGFRTFFTCFHHFPPDRARTVLQDVVGHQEGVGIFEVPKRDWLTILFVAFMPALALALVPFIRPFRWSRLLWAYVIPALPLVLWFDGVVSCLRAYTPLELRELTRRLAGHGYHWESGEEENRRLPVTVTYLIGYPLNC